MSSFFQQTKHRRLTGMVDAPRAAMCTRCATIHPRAEIWRGWCVGCLKTWAQTADPSMLTQVQKGYCAPDRAIPAPTKNQSDRILEYVLTPKRDEDFIPLLCFLGNGTIGRMQALWNLLKAMQTLELRTSADVFKLTVGSHDLTHTCGLHAPVQKSSLEGFLSRVLYAENCTLLAHDPGLADYLRWFIRENQNLWLGPRTRITPNAYRSRRAWRQDPRASRWQPLAEYWPFLADEHTAGHEAVLAVDAVIPKQIPEQWRQDMCQDLMVAVLRGDVSVENLRDAAPEYMRRVWALHPIKYAPLSLDAPPPWAHDDTRTLGDILTVSHHAERAIASEPELEHRYDAAGRGTWHEGRNRTVGLATIGQTIRAKQSETDQAALERFRFEPEEEADSDIVGVYLDDLNPRFTRINRHAATAHPERIRP